MAEETELIAELELDDLRIGTDELTPEKPSEYRERFLVISSLSKFASTDVWAGLCGALQNLGFFVLPYALDKMRAFLAIDFMMKDIVATAVSVRNNFTHVIFVGAVFIPDWVVFSIRRAGVKVIYWSIEDPHALDQNVKFYDWADYYFTNEAKVPDVLPNSMYLPTAADPNACMPPRVPIEGLSKQYQDIMRNDVVFCGNVYPNRQIVLEALLPFFEEHKIRFGFVGITSLMKDRENSPLLKYVLINNSNEKLEGIVDHRWLIMLYGYAKISLNLERDPFFEYHVDYSTNRKYKVIGESLNPRAYEIALCSGSLQMIDNKRKELFNGHSIQHKKHCIVFDDIEHLKAKILYYLSHEEERKAIVTEARTYVLEKHTYYNRAIKVVNKIRLVEGRKELIMKDLLERLRKK